MPLFKIEDEEKIIKAAKNGNEEAIEYLIEEQMNIVLYLAKSFFIKGQNRDDVIQEGRIGLYKAIQNYDIDGRASFNSFCAMCVYRQLVTAIKTANRDKHLYLNNSTSLDKPFNYTNETDRNLNDVLANEARNTEEEILYKELVNDLFIELNDILTELEWDVFKHYLDGKSYEKIANILDIKIKCVDNALYI